MRNVSLSIISSHKIDLCPFFFPKCVRNSVVKTISDTWRWTTPITKRWNEEARRNEFITSIITSYKWNKSYQMYTFFFRYILTKKKKQNLAFTKCVFWYFFFHSSCSSLWFGSLHSYLVLLQLLWFVRSALITSTKVHIWMAARVRQTEWITPVINDFRWLFFSDFVAPFTKPRMIL